MIKYKFSTRSEAQLLSCHPNLVAIFNEVIKHIDCTVIEGYRSNTRQDELLRQGKTTLSAGKSKHNHNPSLAVDVAPYLSGKGIPWDDKKYFYYFAGLVKGVAAAKRIKLRWGGDWNTNNNLDDQTFFDLPHFELI